MVPFSAKLNTPNAHIDTAVFMQAAEQSVACQGYSTPRSLPTKCLLQPAPPRRHRSIAAKPRRTKCAIHRNEQRTRVIPECTFITTMSSPNMPSFLRRPVLTLSQSMTMGKTGSSRAAGRGLNSPAARQAFGAPQNGPGRAACLESLIGSGRSSKNLDAC
jgi:hypothetical protein